ncbi:MAG: hypothetical protein M3Y89_13205 [Actinomycetota bacterium]|nr:hypothetical protein [Actinomycetota bacterium]
MSLGDACIYVVAEGTRAHVDHHIVDLARMLLDEAQHFPEHLSLLDGLRRRARLQKLSPDLSAKGSRLALGEVSLGRDGVAVCVNVDRRVHLALA